MLLDDEGAALLPADASFGLGRRSKIALVMIGGERAMAGLGHGSAPCLLACRLAWLFGRTRFFAADALLQRFHEVDDIVALGPRCFFLFRLGDLALLALFLNQRPQSV